MATRDLSAYFDDGALDYPGVPSKAFPDGKTYRVPSPDAKTGVWFAAIAELGAKQAGGVTITPEETASLILDDAQELVWYERVLGSAYQQMLDDGVSWTLLKRIGDDAYLCFGLSATVADVVLAAQGEALARANRAGRRKSTARKPAGSNSRRASGVTRARTRNPASTPSSTSPTVPEVQTQTA